MRLEVKEFIQEHIELIDSEMWHELLHATIDSDTFLYNSAVAELAQVLQDIGCDITSERKTVLFEMLEEHKDGIRMPMGGQLRPYLDLFFLNIMGFTIDEFITLVNTDERSPVYVKLDYAGREIIYRKPD